MAYRFLILLVAFIPSLCLAQDTEDGAINPIAVSILDRMSTVIGDLSSCSFTLHSSHDVEDNTFFLPEDGIGPVKQFGVHEIAFSGPDRFQINSWDEHGHKGFWYNGAYLAFYSFTNNHFAVVETPETSLETIYQVHDDYDVDFPASDFFNPSFTDDLIANSEKIIYLGQKQVLGKTCFHILAKMEDMSVQLWLSNDAYTLPVKFVINYLGKEHNPQYEGTFSQWDLNPLLPDAMFEFIPPANADVITMVPKSEE